MGANKPFATGSCYVFGALVVGALTGCLAKTDTQSSGASGGALTTTGQTVSIGQVFKVSGAIASTSLNLGETKVVSVTLAPVGSYRGQATLSLDSAAFKTVDPGASISAKFSPSTVDFGSGTPQTVTIALTASTMAPDLTGGKVPILVTEAGQNLPYVLGIPVPLDVLPVLNVEFHGGAVPETMMQGASAFAQKSNINVANHKAGVTVNFTNYDTTATANLGGAKDHLVHGQGSIPHESTGGTGLLPASTTTGPVAGSTYTVKVTTQTASTTGQFYCHQHESGTNARTITFNVPVKAVPPVIVPSGNPNATFTYVNDTIFKNYQCATCHGSASAAQSVGGGNDLSSYAAVQNFVVAGSPNASSLYLAVLPPNGSMPKMAPGSMSATDLVALRDWINDGAKNN